MLAARVTSHEAMGMLDAPRALSRIGWLPARLWGAAGLVLAFVRGKPSPKVERATVQSSTRRSSLVARGIVGGWAFGQWMRKRISSADRRPCDPPR